jgi:Cys-tRNA(Pro)/Cys-tRNA(Cys) deacylase
MTHKTLAMKLLEGKKIAYEVVTYPENERDAAVLTDYFAVPAGQVFKTLVVVRPSAKPILVMLGADRQLDLKKLAQVVGEKKLKMASHQEAEALTGLQVGGISALALLNRGFLILLDQGAQQYDHIYVSAGQKGLNLKVPRADLVKITGARYVAVGEGG